MSVILEPAVLAVRVQINLVADPSIAMRLSSIHYFSWTYSGHKRGYKISKLTRTCESYVSHRRRHGCNSELACVTDGCCPHEGAFLE